MNHSLVCQHACPWSALSVKQLVKMVKSGASSSCFLRNLSHIL